MEDKVRLNDLLEKGYFPKELPPCFTSMYFAHFSNNVMAQTNSLLGNVAPGHYFNSSPMRFSLPKVGLVRKSMSIPNPYHFYKQAEHIVANLQQIGTFLGGSTLSVSKPDLTRVGQERCFESSEKFGDFLDICLENSVGQTFQVKTDISKYFMSIYTHSISWALHTKVHVKQNLNNRRLLNNLLGHQLDNYVRYCQENQSIGIPIGPDTSLLLSEIIGTALDNKITNAFPNVRGARWVDDYYLYVETLGEAEDLSEFIQNAFREFQLEPNEVKTSIESQPFFFESYWTSVIKQFEFKNQTAYQEQESIRSFFTEVFNLSEKFPNETVLKYTLGRLSRKKIHHQQNWNLFENFVCNCFKKDPSVVAYFLAVLLAHRPLVNLNKIEGVVNSVLNDNINKGKDFEIVWSIWCLISFNFPISTGLIQQVANSDNYLAKTLVYEFLVQTNRPATVFLNGFNPQNYFQEDWMYSYQVYRSLVQPNQVPGYEFFESMKLNNVTFVDLNRQIYHQNFYELGY